MHTPRPSKFTAAFFVVAVGSTTINAAAGTTPVPVNQAVWTFVDRAAADQLALRGAIGVGEPWVRPIRGQALVLDRPKMNAVLATAPAEGSWRAAAQPLIMFVPMPDGSMQRFAVTESPILPPALSLKYPEIRTFQGQGIDDPFANARFDSTPAGFHAQILSPSGAVYIDPYTKGDDTQYTSYYKRDFAKHAPAFRCLTQDQAPLGVRGANGDRQPGLRTGDPVAAPALTTAGTQLRTYRIAVCTTGEYTQYHGGTVVAGFAAVVTAINRVTGIYQTEFAVRLIMANNADQVIFTNPATDPFTSPDDPSGSNSISETQLDNIVGSANYDVGHMFHRTANANGLAGGIGTVCSAGIKGQGYSASDPPIGDPFVVDFVSHEIGHEFGGRHTFSNCGGGAGDSANLAVEPGSGSTIMAYAGICGANDLQPHSDPFFDAINIDQIVTYTTLSTGNSCPVTTASGNNPPTVSAGPNFTIPQNTPFVLTATGSDPDGDTLTFCWEQQDGAAGRGLPIVDNGTGPLFRSWPPLVSPSRVLPRMAELLNNTAPVGEGLPTTNRTLHWRVTARDNRAACGGVATSDMTSTVVTSSGPFRITSPAGGASLTGSTTITWNVANTAAAPVSCANVKISLSTDNGLTFPTVLAASTPNNGSAFVALPNVSTTTARIKVEAVGNIFFDVTRAAFTINPVVNGVNFGPASPQTYTDNTGNGNSNGVIDPGESDIRITVPVINTGATTATGVVGTLSSLTATATVTGASRSYPDLPNNASGSNASPFVLSVLAGHPCGSPISLRLTVTANEGSNQFDFSLPTGSAGGLGAPQTFSWTGAAAIPDNSSTGVSIPFSVSGLTAPIGDLNFRFDGSSCSTDATSTTVGLNHSWVGDLVVTLTSPSNTSVILINRAGGGTFGSSGHNFCQTLLDDGAFPAIQSIDAAGAGAPYTGTYSPANPLASFIGQGGNGTWTLKVADLASADTGTVQAFSIIIQTNNPPVCTPPLANVGACCAANGSCTSDTQTNCANAGRLYRGDNSTCTAAICAGACCHGGVNCTVENTAATCGAPAHWAGPTVACNAPGNHTSPCCQADFNGLNGVTVQDLFAFLSAYFSNNLSADFDHSNVVSVGDLFIYLAVFFAGCS